MTSGDEQLIYRETTTGGRGMAGLHSAACHGAARPDYTIVIAFAGVVFFTGDTWILPVAESWLPAFGDWLSGLSFGPRLAVCGVIALIVTGVAVGSLVFLTRRK